MTSAVLRRRHSGQVFCRLSVRWDQPGIFLVIRLDSVFWDCRGKVTTLMKSRHSFFPFATSAKLEAVK